MTLSNPYDKIIDFTSKLVSIPSYETEKDVADEVYKKLTELGFKPEIIASDLDHPSVFCHIQKPGAKKTVWFEATLDTVEPGNMMKWDTNPLQPTQKGDNLYGLGVSDSKFAVAEFIYLAKSLYENPEFESSIFLGFDAAEQSGKFAGIRDVIEYVPECDLCILGYQDFNKIHIGARGWLRVKLVSVGVPAHSGRSGNVGVNAVHNMIKMINEIMKINLKDFADEYFPYGPKINITQIKGGEAVNVIPDKCECTIDIRLTPKLSPEDMITYLGNTLRNLQLQDTEIKYQFNIFQSEPAYLTDPNDKFVEILFKNSKETLNPDIIIATSGPGSVGNLISQRFDIPIINAFGVRSDGVHAPNEYIDLSTVEPAFKTLEKSLIEWSKI